MNLSRLFSNIYVKAIAKYVCILLVILTVIDFAVHLARMDAPLSVLIELDKVLLFNWMLCLLPFLVGPAEVFLKRKIKKETSSGL